jgi:hypothetical protein
MRRLMTCLVPMLAACATTKAAPPQPVQAPSPSPDVAAIQAVLAQFSAALPAHDAASLNALWLSPEIPFRARVVDHDDVIGDVIDAGTGSGFATAVSTATTPWEEHLSDVQITARDGIATLDAAYTFADNHVQTNHGREIWVLIQATAGWKIASVTWSIVNDKPPGK